MGEPLGSDPDLAQRLGSWLAEVLASPGIVVTGLRRLGGGSSRENWAFEIEPGGGRPMLLRRDPVASVADTDRAQEVGVLQALAGGPVPAPVIVAADPSGERLERPSVVMERSPGRADRSVLRDRDPLRLGEAGRLELAASLADLLADVHSVDVGDALVATLGAPPADPAAAEIERWTAEIERVRLEPQPELVHVATWLWEHRPPPPERITVVHGDFRPANVLVRDDGAIERLLDWEFAHLGDPAEDLGWYTTPLYVREHFVPHAWGRQEFLGRYGTQIGADPAVDAARLRFWEVLALYKLAAIALAGVASFLAGETDRAAGPVDGLLRTVVAATRTQETAA